MESTTLAITLPWGQLHATPWDRNVNEAAVEWPPSLWRLLRALYATWRHRAPELDAAVVRSVLAKLAEPPTFRLPPGRIAHTRHYMPDRQHRSGEAGRSVDKVIDSFIVTEHEAELLVTWPFEMAAGERQVLTRLAGQLPYLGRAESICTARLDDGALTRERDDATIVRPVSVDVGLTGQPTQVLCPRRPLDLDALTVSTVTVRTGKRLTPSGAEFLRYEIVELAATATRRRQAERKSPEAFRWAVEAKARPALTAAVVMGDALRLACLSKHGAFGIAGGAPRLAGRSVDGAKADHQHQHAHYLSLSSAEDPRIDTMLLWAPSRAPGEGCLDSDEVRAVSQTVALRGFGYAAEFRPVNLVLEAAGRVADIAPELCGRAQTWQSSTPFVPPRHRKRKQSLDGFLNEQVAAELRVRGLPEPELVELVEIDPHPLRFRRHRLKEKLRDTRPAYGLRVTFDETVHGPLSLGGLSHFGLGLFIPAE